MFCTKLFGVYTVLAVLAHVTDAYGFGDVPVWLVMLPFLLALCEPAWYMFLAWREGLDDDEDDPDWPPGSKIA